MASIKYLGGALSQRASDYRSNVVMDVNGGPVHMYSPRVENSINTYFSGQQRDEMDKRLR